MIELTPTIIKRARLTGSEKIALAYRDNLAGCATRLQVNRGELHAALVRACEKILRVVQHPVSMR